MAVKSGGGPDKEPPEAKKKAGGKQISRKPPGIQHGKKPDSHAHQGRNNRQHKKQQKYKGQADSSMTNLGYDLDFSIQEELNSGKYKFRGGKAQVSINHLLQFQLPEIERNSSSAQREAARRKNKLDNAVHLHGDSFINANYRLLVDDRYDYEDQSIDPNVPVPQERIVRVIVPRGQTCPICLEEPVAPQMVACGHIFCHSCLLNFFSVEDAIKEKSSTYVKKKTLKECPLCGSIVRPNKVKPVLFEDDPLKGTPQPNFPITMTLMCKPHGSLLPLPVHLGIDPLRVGDFPSAEFDHLSKYAHIMKCSPNRSVEMLQKDVVAINTQYEIDKILYNDGGKFCKSAIGEIEARISSISEQVVIEIDVAKSISNIDLGVELREKYNDSSAFFFFQTAFQSSVKYFLSPLDVKILLTSFQQYSLFPNEISLPVQNVHYGTTVTEDLIARYKYFNHLPLGTEIAFIDLDWRDNSIISKEVELQFMSELKQRRRKLHIKLQREDKEKLKYQDRIEKEHQEFYRRENGEPSFNEVIGCSESSSTKQMSLDSLSASTVRNTDSIASEDPKNRNAYVERTIWGTSIRVTQDNQTSKENEEFEAMLLQKMQESEDSDKKTSGKKGKKGKKSKGKLMLFSSTHQTL